MSWNQQLGKTLNKQTILQSIFAKKYLSRNELVQITGLKKATVANLVSELIEEQLLLEDGEIQSTGGRRSRILRINEAAGYALGIDVGVNYLRGEVVDFMGKVVFEHVNTIRSVDFKVYTEEICKLIHVLIDNVPPSPYHILGLGVAVPGLIDPNGVILHAPNLKWYNMDLYSPLKEKYDFPIYIMNEANAGAYAEYILEDNNTIKNLLYVSVGIGIGVGMILNEQFYQGSYGVSGENGHTTINMYGRQCTCGRVGCWEAYASEYALLEEASNLLPNRQLTLDYLIDLAEEGNHLTLNLFDELGKYIGIGVTNLIHTINPDKVIIGNRITKARKYIEHSLFETIQMSALPYHLEHCDILFSTNEDRSIVLGAAALAIVHFIEYEVS